MFFWNRIYLMLSCNQADSHDADPKQWREDSDW
jgi:hypothetical protein